MGGRVLMYWLCHRRMLRHYHSGSVLVRRDVRRGVVRLWVRPSRDRLGRWTLCTSVVCDRMRLRRYLRNGFGVVILVVILMIVVTLEDLVGPCRVLGARRTSSVTQDQLDVVSGLTLARLDIRRLMYPMTGVKSKVVVVSIATDWREINPYLGLVGMVDRVSKVDFVHALVNAVGLS
jgi:hypothetical protein